MLTNSNRNMWPRLATSYFGYRHKKTTAPSARPKKGGRRNFHCMQTGRLFFLALMSACVCIWDLQSGLDGPGCHRASAGRYLRMRKREGEGRGTRGRGGAAGTGGGAPGVGWNTTVGMDRRGFRGRASFGGRKGGGSNHCPSWKPSAVGGSTFMAKGVWVGGWLTSKGFVCAVRRTGSDQPTPHVESRGSRRGVRVACPSPRWPMAANGANRQCARGRGAGGDGVCTGVHRDAPDNGPAMARPERTGGGGENVTPLP